VGNAQTASRTREGDKSGTGRDCLGRHTVSLSGSPDAGGRRPVTAMYIREIRDQERSDGERSMTWRSSGKEPFVFSVDSPCNLVGVHANLMEEALRPEERFVHLLYSPIYPAPEAPFGIRAHPSSHAVAITDHRFIISEDRHVEGTSPTIRSIPFPRVLCLDLGNALLLGWFVVRFVDVGGPACASLLYTATGRHHFESLVRKYRAITAPVRRGTATARMDWSDIWAHAPRTQVNQLRSLIMEGEHPVRLIRSWERWGSERRKRKRRPVCLATDGILLLTDFGVIYAVDEPHARPDAHSYGVNVSCIPLDALRQARLMEKEGHATFLQCLQLVLGRDGATAHVEVPIGAESAGEAADLVLSLSRRIPSEE